MIASKVGEAATSTIQNNVHVDVYNPYVQMYMHIMHVSSAFNALHKGDK